MAERFPDCDPKQLQELKENAENTNTKKSVEYVTYEENPTKTRQGGLRKKRRVVQPKMFERFPDIQEQFCITAENYLFERSHV